ncbi:MAG: glycosyltransferase family 4 protein [Candidatus Andersenbacteria bacterium]|nr:glycosyltransferase family 4 protein [Candidatus Andersenbacteria bacterium]
MNQPTIRIAQVGPLWEQIPPPHYGGTERVISYLTERLVQQGYAVTLFACGTSKTSAQLHSTYPRPLIRDGIPWTNLMYPLLNITSAFDRADEFDILHVHLSKASDYLALPLAKPLAHKVVFTMHFPYPVSQGRVDRHLVLQQYRDLNFISVSNAQRAGGENLHWLATIYHGIDLTAYQFHAQPQKSFVWIGKFNPDKGVREAIQAAKQAKVKLILAGPVDKLDPDDKHYYEKVIAPLIDGKQITYVGEVTDAQKNDLFGQATAFLNPIQWNEPFGLTMVEAMACGTPVIAYAAGAAPELIAAGKTGFLVHTVKEMVQHMHQVHQLDRRQCRHRVEQLFSAKVMTANYVAAYQKMVGKQL